MSNVFTFRMPNGIPGDISRKDSLTVEPALIGATAAAEFGLAVQLDSSTGTVLPMASNASARGLLVRPYPAQNTTTAQGSAAPVAGAQADVMRRGYMTVKCVAGTPAPGGAVYVQVVAASGKPVGSISAADDAGNREVLTGCTFMGAADADGNVEISYNI